MRFLPKTPGAAAVKGRGGFTLLEILIIALIISILSGIAVINVQQFVESNKRKAVIADARQLSQALSFAHNDIGFFPKMCFLDKSGKAPGMIEFDPGDGFVLGFHQDFHVYGADYRQNATVRQWKGPYMGVSPNRSGSAQVRGSGTSIVEIAADPDIPDSDVVRWPADAWGNPYLLYATKWVFDAGAGRYVRRFVSVDNPANFNERADASIAVVSYGPNQVPGLEAEDRFDFNSPKLISRRGLRLYFDQTDPPGQAPANVTSDYRMRPAADLASNPGFADIFDQDIDSQGPAITGVGSDDIIFEF